jgi:hypothetical protein
MQELLQVSHTGVVGPSTHTHELKPPKVGSATEIIT